MDSVTLILAALAAGAGAGLKDATSRAVSDAYGALKSLVSTYITDADALPALHGPSSSQADSTLGKAIVETKAADDPAVVQAAEELLTAVYGNRATVSKFMVSLEKAQVGQVGDHNTGTFTFNTAPSGPVEK